MDRCGLANESINGMIVPLAQAQRLEELCLRTDIRNLGPYQIDPYQRMPPSDEDAQYSILISFTVEINSQMAIFLVEL